MAASVYRSVHRSLHTDVLVSLDWSYGRTDETDGRRPMAEYQRSHELS